MRYVPRRYGDGSFHLQEKHGEASNQSIHTLPVETEDELIERLLTNNYYLRMEREDGQSKAYTQIRLASLNIPEVGHFQQGQLALPAVGPGGAGPAGAPGQGDHPQGASGADPDVDEEAGPYVPADEDRRAISYRKVRERQGQTNFRKKLLRRYPARCMISASGVFEVIEAAHIQPYRQPEDNHVENGLLLRSDLHTLFDANLIGIDPATLRVRIHPSLQGTEYWAFDGHELTFGARRPSEAALRIRWKSYEQRLTEEEHDGGDEVDD